MATVKVSSEMAAPVERVFQAFTDIEHGVDRVSGIKGIEILSPRGFSLGTRWRETREVLGRQDQAEMEVTAFEMNRSYTTTQYKAGVRKGCRPACSRPSSGPWEAKSARFSATTWPTSSGQSSRLPGSKSPQRPIIGPHPR